MGVSGRVKKLERRQLKLAREVDVSMGMSMGMSMDMGVRVFGQEEEQQGL